MQFGSERLLRMGIGALVSDENEGFVRRYLTVLFAVAAVVSGISIAYRYSTQLKLKSLEHACDDAVKAQRWQELENAGSAWAKLEPDSALPWLYAAEGANRQGDAIRTALYLFNLPDSDSRSSKGLMQLSHIQFEKLNQAAAGAKSCERVLAIDPSNVDASSRLLYFFAMSRQRSKLIQEAKRAIAQGSEIPSTYLYLVSADYLAFNNGGEVNARWLRDDPSNSTFAIACGIHQLTSGMQSDDQSELDQIKQHREQIAKDLLKTFPASPEVLAYHLDRACFQADEQQAIELLANAPAQTANDSRFWRYKGFVHTFRGEDKQAAIAFERALELFPYDWIAQGELAAVYRRQQNFDRVQRWQTCADQGKNLQRQIMAAPNTNDFSPQLLETIQKYVSACGETRIAEQIGNRLRAAGVDVLSE